MKYFALFIVLTMTLTSCMVNMAMREVTGSLNNKSNNKSNGKQVTNVMPSKPGSCFAKAKMPDRKVEVGDALYLFTGDVNNTDVEIEEIEIVTQIAGTKWVKKKADKNCLSANPDDCLVWCLVDVPSESENYTVVVDTSATDQYEVFYRTEVVKGSPEEWIEVVCQEKITKDLISQLQSALFAMDLYVGSTNGVMDNRLMDALAKYQSLNQLPIGHLDFETLDSLGIGR